MLAADAELEVGTHRPAALDADADKFADAVHVDGDERVLRQQTLRAVYSPRKRAESSRLMPKQVCVRSLVPNEKNSADCAISPARRQARGSSIMVPHR